MGRRHDEVTAALRDRILSGSHLGLVKEGSRLPSVRDVAKEFGATPRTVMAAYRQLERENLVRLRPRSGIYLVAPHASESAMLSQIGAWAVDVLVQGLMRNIAPISLPKHLGRCLETVTVRTACIGDNADQICSLCWELSADYGLHTSGVDLQTIPAGRKAEDYFNKVDLLVSTPLHAAAVKSLGRRLRKPWLIVSLRQEVVRQVASLIESEDLFFLMTDPRFAETLKKVFGHLPNAHRIHPVIVGGASIDALPRNATVYLMRSAQRKLQKPLSVKRVIFTPRVLSLESAREILSLVVRANIEALRLHLGK